MGNVKNESYAWTTETPRSDGYYWVKAWGLARIGFFTTQTPDGPIISFGGDDYYEVGHFLGEVLWSGPIPEPN